MITKTVGTTPEILLNPNPKRRRWWIQFLPNTVASGNTGLIFLGMGHVPIATVGHPQQGEVLIPSASKEEVEQYLGDPIVYKGAIWIVSDTATQTINYEEEIGT